jgi:uncharacterized protein YfaS (alpha-2-macroglobulin family)
MFKKITSIAFLLILNFLSVQAQNLNDFGAEWKKIEALEKQGLTKSALSLVDKILASAKAANNDPQQIKAVMFQLKYRNGVEEDSQEKNIHYLDTLIAQMRAPAKNILQSMQASMLLSYKQINRYKLYSRTALASEISPDISTWSVAKLNSVIAQRYMESIRNESVLKNTKIGAYEAILEKGANARNLRPTLFDFLGFRALGYFMSTENDVTNPSYKFILNDPAYFEPAKTFAMHAFHTADTASLYFHAIQILQRLIAFHLADANPAALIDADLSRLAFVHEHGIFVNKDKLYEESLQQLEQTYDGNPLIAEAAYRRAFLYLQSGNTYNRETNKTVQFDIKKAKDLAEQTAKKYPGSEGALNSLNLVAQIIRPSLNLTSEKVNSIGLPFKSLLKYKNINQLYFRTIKVTRQELKAFEQQEYEKMWSAIVKLKPVQTWNVFIPQTGDYQEHLAETKTDGLPSGIYLILASKNEDFSLTNNLIARQVTYVSNISYITGDKKRIYVVDRNTGEALPNAEIQLWQNIYNPTSRKYEEVKLEKSVTDKDGAALLKTKPDVYNNRLQVKYVNDELFTDDNYFSYNYDSYSDKSVKTSFLFTDRSIYRPGQTIFFKGIMISKDATGRKSTVLANFKTAINLFDVNGQKVSSLKLVSNEYGSYNGSFKLPANGLSGQFYIEDTATKAQQYFNVEEYKRPKFFVEISKPSGSYRLNDSITVKGNAKAYAGNNIDGAQVAYRVVRKIQYPIWFGWGRRIFPPRNQEQMEITNGIATTDANGQFIIKFKAIPDENADKKNQPMFYFEVSADVTDLNGETRSASTQVSVAFQAIRLNIAGLERLSTDSIKSLRVTSTNANDLFEKTLVHLTMAKLKSPQRILKERYWEAPDQFILTKEEHAKLFPNDPYADEDQVSKWETGEVVIDKTDTTSATGRFSFPSTAQQPGWYKITVTGKDKFGEPVSAEKFIYIFSKEDGSVTESLIVNTEKKDYEPGSKAAYSFITGFDNIHVIQEIVRSDNNTKTDFIGVKNGKPYNSSLSLGEDDRGDVVINYIFVKNNRLYKGTERISIPWKNKQLNISYETFRDKILPGAAETWKINITGNKSEKVAAESLISMYDASLDQFKPHSWTSLSSLWPMTPFSSTLNSNNFSFVNSQENYSIRDIYQNVPSKVYDELLQNGWIMQRVYLTGKVSGIAVQGAPIAQDAQMMEVRAIGYGANKKAKGEMSEDADTTSMATQGANPPADKNVQIRKNFNETAFFFPDLKTDSKGNISFSFTIPEALTTWKLMTMAHSKDLASAYSEKTVITQKPLMVQPNAPRFLREGDEMEFTAKIVNLSDSEITGTTQLELFDIVNNKVVDGWFKNIFPNQYFTVAAGQSAVVKFPIGVPISFNSALQYRIKAISKDGSFTDGEEAAIPVLSNRTLVTETLPLNMRNTTSKQFTFDKLLKSANSGTLTNKSLTLEYTSNPAWYAVQALPYLMEFPYECAEQSFNRYYANTLASFISNSSPKIKAVFDKWKITDTASLMSNLQKNEELKSALLQETPWVMEAKNEQEQKKNIALLFDMVRLAKEKSSTLQKLKEMQLENGGFAWFKGGRDDRYMTQYIITGIGHLKQLKALEGDDYSSLKPIVDKALPYLDARLKDEYDNLIKYKADLKKDNLSSIAIQYLYMRSFFPDQKVSTNAATAVSYFKGQEKKFWLTNSKYEQAMIALTLNRGNDQSTAKSILKSLKENAIYKDEMGMYFKEFTTGGYYWYQAPVESQAMIIEAFSEVEKNMATVDDLKTWLLKQKQTQNWRTTKATAEACYALLIGGSNWLNEEKVVDIQLGNITIKSSDEKTSEGTGYFQHVIDGPQVQQGMGNIVVKIAPKVGQALNAGPTSWGAVYWQYFENLDKISTTGTASPLSIVRKLYVEKNSDKGPQLKEVKDGDELQVGDKIKVRIEIKADRDMEYVHLKDMRAACMEPVNVLSSYKYQGGLGYYEATKDASTNFFFSWLPRGSYVFEYPLFITHGGNYSIGISTIQCMYAPEFSSHSEGLRVTVQ